MVAPLRGTANEKREIDRKPERVPLRVGHPKIGEQANPFGHTLSCGFVGAHEQDRTRAARADEPVRGRLEHVLVLRGQLAATEVASLGGRPALGELPKTRPG